MKCALRLKRNYLLLLLPVSLLALTLAKSNAWIAEEIFAKRLSKAVGIFLSLFSSILPFSLFELLLLIIPLGTLLLLIVFIIRLIRKKDNRSFRIGKAISTVLCVVSVAAFLYVMNCGVLYYRSSVSVYTELTVRDSSIEELTALCEELVTRANSLRENLPEDEEGVFDNAFSVNALRKATKQAYSALEEEYPIFARAHVRVKPLHVLSGVMSQMQLTGIFMPLTGEANVNINIPDYSLASTMCHELAHLHGFMREDEANYIGYLACMASAEPTLQYSGTMSALIHAGNSLYAQDADAYFALWATYSEGVMRDLYANSAYWEQYEETVISEVAEQVNDTYLKINAQEDGVKSYGRMVDFLLAEYRKNHNLQ